MVTQISTKQANSDRGPIPSLAGIHRFSQGSKRSLRLHPAGPTTENCLQQKILLIGIADREKIECCVGNGTDRHSQADLEPVVSSDTSKITDPAHPGQMVETRLGSRRQGKGFSTAAKSFIQLSINMMFIGQVCPSV